MPGALQRKGYSPVPRLLRTFEVKPLYVTDDLQLSPGLKLSLFRHRHSDYIELLRLLDSAFEKEVVLSRGE